MKVKPDKEVYLTVYAAIRIVFNSTKLVHLSPLAPRLSGDQSGNTERLV